MRFAILLIPVATFWLGTLLGRRQRDGRLTRPERDELARLRALRNNLMREARDKADVEPLWAAIVLDEISKTYEDGVTK